MTFDAAQPSVDLPSFAMLDASPYPQTVYDLDFNVWAVNRQHLAMTGVTREDMVGRFLFDVFPTNPDDPGADAQPAMRASLERMVATGEPDEMDVVKHDLRRPDGGFGERYWQITHSPVWSNGDGTGRIIGALQTTRDVTAEVVRQKIHAAQQRSATIGGQLAFFEFDFETGEVEGSVGYEELHGYEPGEAGSDVSAYLARVHEEDRDEAVAVLGDMRAAPSHTEGHLDYRLVWPDGTVRWVTARFEVVREGEGVAPKLTGMILDVTDLRQSEAQLRAAVAARDMLLAEVNHRVKNSLQLVTSVLNVEATEADRAGEAGAERLRAAAARVGAIATVHAALYHGDDVRSVEFGAFLDTLCGHLAASVGAEARGIAITVEAEPVRVATDRAISLSLVVNELVANAFKHAFPDGREGTVRVTLRREGADRLSLEVADNGTGAGPAALTFGTVPSGGGLGHRLIDMLARQIGAEIRRDDRDGVRVRLDLPL